MNPRHTVPAHVVRPTGRTIPNDTRYEWRVVDIARDVTRSEARTVLTEQAEYGRWELARTQLFYGGARRVWLRRRVMNVRRSDAA